MKKFLVFIIITCQPMIFFTVLPLSANDEKIRLAVTDFKADGVPEATAGRATELLRIELVNLNKFNVIERGQMGAILKEQGLQQTGCTDLICAVEMGKLLSANKMLIGTVMNLDGSLLVTAKIVDVEKGNIDFAEKQESSGEKDLNSAMEKLAEKLSQRLEEYNSEIAAVKMKKEETVRKEEERKRKEKEDKLRNPYIWPSAGLSILTISSFGAGYYCNTQVNSLNKKYKDYYRLYTAATSADEAGSLHARLNNTKKDIDNYILYRNISYGAGGALALLTGYLIYEAISFESPQTGLYESGYQIVPFIVVNDMFSENSYKNQNYFGGGVMIHF